MCCIIATRHIHINDTDENKYGLKDNDVVKVKCKGVKGGIMDNVVVKKNASYVFELHLDTDDANSHGLVNGDMVEIVK
ncbi:MAG: PduL/EutD family phosphate acyltransferase [bacterium]|nr:PduL/EutD family phosphate acyltransferase [bacterium]